MVNNFENELRGILEDHGKIVIRSAGSMGEADLVMINPITDQYTLIECKSISHHIYYISNTKKDQKQWHEIKNKVIKNGIKMVYAVRYKKQNALRGKEPHEKWRFWTVQQLICQDGDLPIMNLNDADAMDLLTFLSWR